MVHIDVAKQDGKLEVVGMTSIPRFADNIITMAIFADNYNNCFVR